MFSLKNVVVTIANRVVEGLNVDTQSASFKDHYFRLFWLNSMGNGGHRKCCSITLNEFLESSCFLTYDFTASLNQTDLDLAPLTKLGKQKIHQ